MSTISFMYRYLAVLSDEASRLVRARASRSADLTGHGGGSIRWRAGVVGGMVGSLFIRSYERSERVTRPCRPAVSRVRSGTSTATW